MMNIIGKKKTKVRAKLEDGALTVCVKAKDKSKTVYLSVGEFIASEFSVKSKGDSFALIMKCEEEKIEKEIANFETKKEADTSLEVVSAAMMVSQGKGRLGAIIFAIIKWGTIIAIVGGLFMAAFGMFINMTSSAPTMPEKAQAPKQGLQQEYLPEGKPVPLEDVVQ